MCFPGSYSNSGSSSCILCPVGRYGNEFGASSSFCSGKCESVPGSFCDLGTTSSSGIPCGVGYFSGSAGLSFRSSCIKCPLGYYSTSATSSRCELVSPGMISFIVI